MAPLEQCVLFYNMHDLGMLGTDICNTGHTVLLGVHHTALHVIK